MSCLKFQISITAPTLDVTLILFRCELKLRCTDLWQLKSKSFCQNCVQNIRSWFRVFDISLWRHQRQPYCTMTFNMHVWRICWAKNSFIDWLIEWCLTPRGQYFSHIVASKNITEKVPYIITHGLSTFSIIES